MISYRCHYGSVSRTLLCTLLLFCNLFFFYFNNWFVTILKTNEKIASYYWFLSSLKLFPISDLDLNKKLTKGALHIKIQNYSFICTQVFSYQLSLFVLVLMTVTLHFSTCNTKSIVCSANVKSLHIYTCMYNKAMGCIGFSTCINGNLFRPTHIPKFHNSLWYCSCSR